ncbi:MAG: putative Zn finger-like uncharacterized protein, partial [Planctomycetota bacterium]
MRGVCPPGTVFHGPHFPATPNSLTAPSSSRGLTVRYAPPMIIECPACKSRAKLPDSKEGAKVRCSGCSRVYVAKPARAGGGGGRAKPETDPTKYVIGALGVALILGLFAMSRGKGTTAPPKVVVEEKPELEPLPDTDWNSPVVQIAVKLHTWAFERNDILLSTSLAQEYIWKEIQAAKTAAGEEASTLPWAAIPQGDKTAFFSAVARDMMEGQDADLIGNWSPFDGHVLDIDLWEEPYKERVSPGEEVTVVRLQVAPRDIDSGLGNRWVEWAFVKLRGKHVAFSWKRWLSPEEMEKVRRNRTKKTVKRELADGSVVIEGKVRTIDYEADTPQAIRDEVDGLIVELLSPDSKPYKIQQRLKEIGKPAIPALLTQLATIPFETEEHAIQLNLVHLTLQEITGYQTTFQVSDLMGATRERQESGLLQWFGWYDRKYKRFSG